MMSWTAKSNDITVQCTNDCSILSKHAMCHAGYMRDDYLDAFTGKAAPRRAPLINRGYYIRMKAVDSFIRAFLAVAGPKQIVSVGAGFDTLLFRLHSDSELTALVQDTYLVEIDFEQVAERKRSLILNNSKTKGFLADCHVCRHGSRVKLSSRSYCLIGADLSDMDDLRRVWDCETLVVRNHPTLVLSECVMTYMNHQLSTNLIAGVREYFEDSLFVTYEQVRPWDAFGRFMRSHFDKLNSSLKAITTYDSPERQRLRYLNCGYSKVDALTMNAFYLGLPAAERERVRLLERFDEYEEWRLKCAHYVMVLARSGETYSRVDEVIRATAVHDSHDVPWANAAVGVPPTLTASPVRVSGLALFSHASTTFSLAGTDHLLVHGGFGAQENGRHGRNDAMRLYRITAAGVMVESTKSRLTVPCRLHHTLTPLADCRLLMFGGRLSPSVAFADPLLIRVDPATLELSLTHVTPVGDQLSPRWRHAAVRFSRDGEEFVLITGGLEASDSCASRVLQTCCLYSVTRNSSVETPDLPAPLHSHAMCYDGRRYVYLSGGLTSDEITSGGCFRLDVSAGDGAEWESCKFTLGVVFSHSLLYFRRWLVLVGGVDGEGQPVGLRAVNTETLSTRESLLPACVNKELFMYFNTTAHLVSGGQLVVAGGGGNCFSFGTHINKSPLLMSLDFFS